jgi:hypothetical protein
MFASVEIAYMRTSSSEARDFADGRNELRHGFEEGRP